jgi:sigma-E factor negative regulatory protein RseA
MDILMDTNKKIREHISALKDGELSASDIELAFAALHTEDGRQAWEVYHRTGDVLRAQASADLSPDFSARLAERLAAEPNHGRRSNAGLPEAEGKAPVVAASSPAPAP